MAVRMSEEEYCSVCTSSQFVYFGDDLESSIEDYLLVENGNALDTG